MPVARLATRFLALALLAVPLGACSLFNKDEALPADQPPDKLYNEGVFLLNRKQSYAGTHPRSSKRSSVSTPIRNGPASRC